MFFFSLSFSLLTSPFSLSLSKKKKNSILLSSLPLQSPATSSSLCPRARPTLLLPSVRRSVPRYVGEIRWRKKSGNVSLSKCRRRQIDGGDDGGRNLSLSLSLFPASRPRSFPSLSSSFFTCSAMSRMTSGPLTLRIGSSEELTAENWRYAKISKNKREKQKEPAALSSGSLSFFDLTLKKKKKKKNLKTPKPQNNDRASTSWTSASSTTPPRRTRQARSSRSKSPSTRTGRSLSS